MKVKRVVINDGQLHAGVVFDTGPNTVGRAIVDLPADACAAILAAAQIAFDEDASAVSQEVQSTALTAELHRLRSTRQDLAIVQRDHAAAIDEHEKRVTSAREQNATDLAREREAIENNLRAKREEADAVAAGLDAVAEKRRAELDKLETETQQKLFEKGLLEAQLAALEKLARLKAVAER